MPGQKTQRPPRSPRNGTAKNTLARIGRAAKRFITGNPAARAGGRVGSRMGEALTSGDYIPKKSGGKIGMKCGGKMSGYHKGKKR